MRDLKRAIRALGGPCCPYCGGMQVGHKIDHFVPRSTYSEFSILSDNLLPCCDECNTQKRDRLPWEVPRLLNPYRSAALATQILQVDYVGGVFELNPKPALGSKLSTMIEAHIQVLKMRENFDRFARDEVISLTCNPRYSNLSSAAICEELLGQSLGYASHFGWNHWRVLLYGYLSANPEVVDGFRADSAGLRATVAQPR